MRHFSASLLFVCFGGALCAADPILSTLYRPPAASSASGDRLHAFSQSARGVCAVGESGSKALVVWIPRDGSAPVRAEFGGSGESVAYAITGDCGPGTIIAGRTTSTDFPAAANSLSGGADGFLLMLGNRLDPAASRYVGGAGDDALTSLAGGYAAGSTTSDFFDGRASLGGLDAFLGSYRLAGQGTGGAIEWRMLERFGGEGDDRAVVLKHYLRDSFSEELLLAGTTSSHRIEGALNEFAGGSTDAFYARFRPLPDRGASLELASAAFVGGAGDDQAAGAVVDSGSGDMRLLLTTDSPSLPGAARFLDGPAATTGGRDAAVLRIEGDGTVAYHLRLGSAGDDSARTIEETTVIGANAEGATFLVTFDDSAADTQSTFPVSYRTALERDAAEALIIDTSRSTLLAGAGFVVRVGPDAEASSGKDASSAPRFASSQRNASATFLGADNATQGAWKTLYGGDGYFIPNLATNYPAYATVTRTGAPFTWSPNPPAGPDFDRALEKPTPPGRFASAIIDGSTFQFDVNLTDGLTHRVALYMHDWNSTTAAQTVAILDQATNTVLDTQSVSGFRSGRYLVYNLQGRVLIRVTRTAGSWAQIAGIFFGGSASGSLTATGGTPQATTVNTPFGTALQVTLRDGSNAPIPNVVVTFTAPSAGASATLSSATAITNASGVASVTATANTLAGAYLVSATANGSTATFSLTNNPGAGASIAPAGGASQSTLVNTAFGAALQAIVRDAFNNPVPGALVTFAAPAAGASAALSSPTATTNGSGVASVTATANSTAGGPYNVEATVAGVVTPANFSLTNTANTPASVTANAGSGQSAAINTPFGTALQAIVRNASNQPVPGVLVTFTPPASGASATLSSATAITNGSGLASVTATANGTAGGPYNVEATVSGVASPANFALTNTSNAPTSIVTNGGTPQSATVNTPFGTALQVLVRNASNNPVSGVTVTFTPPLSGASATLSAPTAITNGSGIASVTATANGTAGGPYNVAATVAGVATAANFALTNTAVGTGGSAVFIAADSTTQGAWKQFYGGEGYFIPNLATNYPAYVTVTNTGAPFTWSSNPPAGPDFNRALEKPTPPGRFASAIIDGSTFQFDMNFTDGQTHRVAFYMHDWNASTSEQTVTILNHATNAVLNTQNVTAYRNGRWLVYQLGGRVLVRVTRTVGSWAQLAGIFFGGAAAGSMSITGGSPQSTPVSNAFATPLQVTVLDGANTPISGATVTFAAPGSGASAGLSATSAITNGSGQASVNATANSLVGSYNVTASYNGATVNFNLTNTAGPPASIAVNAGSGQSTPVNLAFPLALQAIVRDSGNNPVSGVTVTFTPPGAGASASLSSATAVTNAFGIASVTATANTTTGGPYIVSATTAGVGGAADFSLTNLPPAPASVQVNAGGSQSTTVGTPFTTALQVIVRDSLSAPVANATVTFTPPASGASASLSSSTAITNGSGLASVTATANTIAGLYNVAATVSGVAGAANFALTNLAGAAAGITIGGGSPQTTVISTAFATPLKAIVRDASNNPVQGVLVTFTPPASGASATLSSATATTNTSGEATVTATANATLGGPYNVNATAAGVAGSINFALTNGPAGSGNTATFVQSDDVTQGRWKTQYGADGHYMPNLATVLPSYATLGVTGVPFTWSSAPAPADQARALDRPTPPGVFASAVIEAQTIQFDLNLTDNQTHRVAFYMHDWQSTTGAQTFQVLDFSNNAVLHSFNVTASYAQGRWLVYNLRGHVLIRLTRTAGSWAQLAGIFFGGPANGSVTPITGTPQSTPVNTNFPTPLQVRVLNGSGNPISGAVVTFTPPASGASALLSSGTATTDGSGYASVTATANATGGSYNVVASYNGTTGTFQLTNTSGPPASVVATGGGTQIATINTAFGQALQAIVRDSGNNPISGVTVNFAAGNVGGASATLSAASAVTNGAGIASVTATANGTAGAYQVTASVAGVVTPATFNLTNITGSLTPAVVEFVSFDLTTQGWWRLLGRGADGYSFPNFTNVSPFQYGNLAVPATTVVWTDPASNAPSMEKPTGNDRIAAAFTSPLAATAAVPATLEFDLNVNAGRTEQVRLYWMNGDGAARTQSVTILDAATQQVLYTRAIPDFSNGRWMIWNISGHVTIRIAQTNVGQLAVCSGIFFSPKP